ncbi:MAG: tetratricopeptide (TPR) repeat protein [Bacteroidia bacterium]|jgi:tetratricopeptide (TPR) repeat protein
MRKHIAHLLILSFVFALGSGCGSTKKLAKKGLTYEQQQAFNNMFFEASKQKVLGNFSEAARLYILAVQSNPNSHASMYELGNIYFTNRNHTNGIYWAEKAVATNPKYNFWYVEQLATAYSQIGEYRKSADLYSIIVSEDPNRKKSYLDASDQLVNIREYKEALDVLNKFQKRFGVIEEISRKKQILYFQLDRPQDAIKAMKELVASNAKETRYKALLAETYIRYKQYDLAEKTYLNMLVNDSLNGMVHFGLANLYQETNKPNKVFAHLKLAFSDGLLPIEQKIRVLTTYFERMKTEDSSRIEARALSEILVKKHPNDPDGRVMRADILYHTSDFDNARKNLLLATSYDPSQLKIWQKLLSLDDELNNFIWIEEDSKGALEYFPNQPFLYIINAFANYRLQNYARAVKVAEAGLEISLMKNDKIDLMATLADSHNELGNFAKSDAYFDELLELNPKNDGALNNYAYYLAIRNVHLDKALTMIELAISLNNDRPSYQDTYGWIYFQKEEYTKAKEIFEALYLVLSDDAEVIEHFGKTLLKLGETGRGDELLQEAAEIKQKESVVK